MKRKHYKRTTNRSLTIPIILVIVFSFMWVTFEGHYKAKLDINKTAKLYFPVSGYTETIMTLVPRFNVLLLRHVKLRRKSSSLKANMNSFKQQAVTSILSKTTAIIVAIMIATYLPIMIILGVASFILINSTDLYFQRPK